jgi:hypothetical protein
MGYRDRIVKEVLTWEGVEAHPHRFGGTEFTLGRVEIGHIHGDWLVDVPFPKKLRDVLVEEGETQPHHILPESGWTSFYLRKDADVQQALRLLRLSYLHKRARRLKNVDETHYAGLSLSSGLRAALTSQPAPEDKEV